MLRAPAILALIALAVPFARLSHGQVRILPLGDSITHGGQGHASYRYPLWFQLQSADAAVQFVGSRQDLFGGSTPIAAFYPDYFTTFDRDHEGYWGYRTDQIEPLVAGIAAATQPDVVLVHLGTNDVGQQGAAGVANADAWLRAIVGRLRAERPDVRIVFARPIPIGPGTSYAANAAWIGPLGDAVAAIAADSTTAASPIVLATPDAGYDPGSMMQSDGLHPNPAGEAHVAAAFRDALLPLLGLNAPPAVALDAPADGAESSAPASVALAASASDPDGAVRVVRFFASGTLVGADSTAPYAATWASPPFGWHALHAEAEDDSGATRASAPVRVLVAPLPGDPLAVSNASFETPALADGAVADGDANHGGWQFTGTPATYRGVFNPPAGSYPGAGGNGTPAGADGANVAYLFHDGGAADSAIADQTTGAVLEAGAEYVLRVGVGRFLPDQPYAFSTYGGYRIELLAGSTVIARDVDGARPPVGAFRDGLAWVRSDALDPGLFGQPLRVRLALAGTGAPRSTHFDRVRLARRTLTTGAPAAPAARPLALRAWASGARVRLEIASASAATVRVALHDVAGRRFAGVDVAAGPGTRIVEWDAPAAPGLYLASARSGGGLAVSRVVVLR